MKKSLRPLGFTLIELLIVIAILSTVTLLAFEVTGEDRAQLRYSDTRARLNALERAILGRLGPAETAFIGGFAADNGRLPVSVAELLSDSGMADEGKYSAKAPVFDPQPDADCANNGGNETTLNDNEALLIKGHRGNYLGGLAFNGRFRDGWGNENGNPAEDGKNFGWNFNDIAQPLTIESLGADNAPNGDAYAADVAITIRPADWRVPLGGWTLRVENRLGNTGIDIASIKLSASLLVFRNDTAGGHWRRYSTPISEVCLDGDGDGLLNGDATAPCPRTFTLSFPANKRCRPPEPASDTGEAWIPQGRHLLVLVRHDPGEDKDRVNFANFNPGLKKSRILAQITAVAWSPLPEARLEIR